MEKAIRETNGELLNGDFHQTIVEKSNYSSDRAAKSSINANRSINGSRANPKFMSLKRCPRQLQQNNILACQKEMSLKPNKSETFPDAIPSNNALESTSDARKGDVAVDVEFEFEARSRKDGAWYVGYGAKEDEWVNVKNAVRERSLPLEPSECCNVKDGRDQAMYYDAHVKEIRQRLHDIRGCRRLFLVHYDHDHTEVYLTKGKESIIPPENIKIVQQLNLD
ncbi:hypothetical protein QJS10_CPA06g00814 [Acorus calamus]|uniref:SAWADEE domain-containing protein n=1 Tax=Acorus calamus TaxID=4465 RepID=A0AAV9EIZ6_ACOCL|nr:hypothetical protein QJS10_CPA06g00814 [Acorus calamus]